MNCAHHALRIATLFLCITAATAWGMAPMRALQATIETEDHAQEATRVLGYNPNIRIENPGNARPTICMHGWGYDAQSFIDGIAQPLNLASAIHFNFPDSGIQHTTPFPLQFMRKLFKTNFGQMPDVLPFLYVLKTCHESGFDAINVYGISRGGSTAINALAILNNNNYQRHLRRIGINEETRQAIITMLRNGSVCVDAPIKDTRIILRKEAQEFRTNMMNKIRRLVRRRPPEQLPLPANAHNNRTLIQRTMQRIRTLIGNGTDAMIASTMHYIVLPLVTRYKPWREQALNSAQKLAGMNVPILLHVEEHDQNVTNKGDRTLYERLRAHNRGHTYFHKSRDGGHEAHRIELPDILRAFQERYVPQEPVVHQYPDLFVGIQPHVQLGILADKQPEAATIVDE